MRELILGGVRSGKSRHAEQRASALSDDVVYIATAQSRDDRGMAERIAAHRARRPAHWRTVEAPLDLAEAIHAHDASGRVLLVDCLTLWLTNRLVAEDQAAGPPPSHETLEQARSDLVGAVSAAHGHLLLVSNETGLGVMPMNALARRFCDEAGALHQQMAECCERVTWTVAGLAQPLK
ncbi:bifunctional adenosylcobinamide kinase/adenosylcobinamide-phosphate guanylyltransferase [Halorhodospira halophila]|uniref:Bifunctional adenosylcobalamin biosynthesis protein n=1 Tax=Halorhodospira halophila (strain DSM 244 / SL1) TaxID=349124 RepID=A1WY55_HALHL|nr:bifunctional adenosylcobinamide kinase/adenosylcobinamide-phosphate guanylyltransferase [Halorhodospira halophila]ABM62617.1 adenosylcobinamide kinase [Halorhodospira halophila SL1]MBK1728297.1 bifunctional adenosylcobinamide kinase/adenosylcobinamide-phosphate guanylyltransferase [Halorhodospira halophila]